MPSKITREQVFKVCDDLSAAGQNATMQNVLAITRAGGGNFIMKIIREWREHQTSTIASIVPPSLPLTTSEPPPASVPGLADLQYQNVEISNKLDDANRRIASLESEIAQSAEKHDQLRSDFDELLDLVKEVSRPFITPEEFVEHLRHGTPWGEDRLKDEEDNLRRMRLVARGIPGVIDQLLQSRFPKKTKLGLTTVPRRPFSQKR